MSWHVAISAGAHRVHKTRRPEVRDALDQELKRLSTDPIGGGVAWSQATDTYISRVGKYRIFFELEEDTQTVQVHRMSMGW